MLWGLYLGYRTVNKCKHMTLDISVLNNIFLLHLKVWTLVTRHWYPQIISSYYILKLKTIISSTPMSSLHTILYTIMHFKKLLMLTNSNTTRPLGNKFEPFAKYVRDTKYHKWFNVENVGHLILAMNDTLETGCTFWRFGTKRAHGSLTQSMFPSSKSIGCQCWHVEWMALDIYSHPECATCHDLKVCGCYFNYSS